MQGGLISRLRIDQAQPEGADRAATVTREARLGGNLNLARSMEASSTRLDVSLDLPATGSQAGRNVLGRLALGQTVATTLDTFNAQLDVTADDNRDEQRSAAEELIGRRRRTATSGNASWQRQFDERASVQASLSAGRTGFGSGAATAEAFREAQWATSASYRWDELLRLSLQVSRSRFRLDSGDSASTSDNLSLSASRALSEISSVSASIGGYRSRRTTTLRGFACPLPVSFCQAGVVARVPVVQEVQTPSSGTQYQLSYQHSLGERTALSLSASRQLSGTGAGLVEAENASASLRHAVTPQLSWSLVGTRSSSSTPGAGSLPAPRVNALEASLNWALADRLALAASVGTRRFREPRAGTAFASTEISITLQYLGPRIVSSR